MRILILSQFGRGLGLAWKMSQEGHSVALAWPGQKKAGGGIYETHKSFRPLMNKADFILCDSPGFGRYENLFKDRGKIVFGASEFGDMINSRKQAEFLEKCGITLCSNFERKVLIHGFFNGRNWIRPIFLSFKEPYLFPGNLGPIVDCMGSMVVPLKENQTAVDNILEQMIDPLRLLGIRDFVSICLGYDEEFEVSGVACGLNYDVIEAISEGLREPFTDVLFEVAAGIKDEINVTEDNLISVRLTVPPWPYSINGEIEEGLAIEGLNKHNLNHVYLCDVYRTNGGWRAAHDTGVIMKVTARGRTIREARRRVYRTLSNINIPGKQYRLDIGESVDDRLYELRNQELISGI